MPVERNGIPGPAEWIRRGRSNLAIARSNASGSDILFEDLCFEAQQATEKAFKGLLTHHGIDFPKTHSIASLVTLAIQGGISVPDDVARSAELTTYAVETRYPGAPESVTREEYSTALAMSEFVVAWAEDRISRDPPKKPA